MTDLHLTHDRPPASWITRRAAAWLLGLCAGLPVQAGWQDSVVKLDVVRHDGSHTRGSAVRIDARRLLTNCHVVQAARVITASQGAQRSSEVQLSAGDAYRDLCLLDAPDLMGSIAEPAPDDAMQTGMPVLAAGYSGGTFAITQGMVKGLHVCPCDDGKIIQTTAAFDMGASGGGLFDAHGRLIGILTFKNIRGGDYHFAVPIAWYRLAEKQPLDNLNGRPAFWNTQTQQRFLAACALGADKNWLALQALARDWIEAEPRNAEPWAALARAEAGLGKRHQALHAYRKALEIDSAHQEVRWELEKLEFELGLGDSR